MVKLETFLFLKLDKLKYLKGKRAQKVKIYIIITLEINNVNIT